MFRRFAVLSVISLLSAVMPSPQALALTIPLPELAGDYEVFEGAAPDLGAPSRRTVDLVLPGESAPIDRMSVVISGQWHSGELSCDNGFGGREISSFHPPLALAFYSDAYPGETFLAVVDVPNGPFEGIVVDFSHCCPPPDLEFDDLVGTQLHVELFIDWVLVGSCYATVDSYGSLTEVSFEVVGSVSSEASSWGGVKSLFR